MKHLDGSLKFYEDDEGFIEVDEPYYEFDDGRRVMINHVFVADWKDLDGQHEAVEHAAKMSTGQVVSINAGDDNFHFCNEDNIFKPVDL